MLYTEYGEIENNNFVLDTTSVEVDKDKKRNFFNGTNGTRCNTYFTL